MTGAFLAGADKEIVQLLAEQEVPLIGPLTLFPQTALPLNRQVFYLLSGIDGQARALVNFVAGKPELKNHGLVVVYRRSEINDGSLVAIRDQSKKAGLKAPEVYEYAAGGFDAAETVKRLKQSAPDSAVFFLGRTEELLSFISEAEKLSWFPAIFVPGAGVGAGVFGAPTGFDGKVFISFPTTPADQTAEGIKEFRALSEKYKLSSKNVAAQISAYSAAKILVEALKRAGKDVSREKLIQILEGFYDYSSGLTPPITYGPNRRVGAMGAYVVTVNLKEKQFLPASGWVEAH
jgi:ABC-type branched-subunit amino acid transport system substrate-binding protein